MNTTLERPAADGAAPAITAPFARETRYGDAEMSQLREAIDQNTLFYFQGKKVKALEEAFAARNGMKHCVAASSCTAAIHTALMALGISPGDEVITGPITDMGTIVPILWQGAIPVFADLDPLNGALCPQSVADRITPRTRAVVAIHLWGSACDLDRLMSVCERASVPLVEDCAQAFGTTYRGRPVGTFGRIAAFSLNEFKHISCGDGGLVMTNDDELAVRARKCTDKGYDRAPGVVERNPSFLANNYRMTELQGAVALAQLGKLDSIVARRRSWCGGLLEAIQDLPGVLPPRPPEGSDPSWWFFPFRVDPKTLGASAAEFAKALQAEGLPVGAGYIGKPVYEFPLFSQGSAFERGSHPFGSAEYRHGLCPNAESILESMITMAVNEAYTQQNLEESITAIRRNAFWFASRP